MTVRRLSPRSAAAPHVRERDRVIAGLQWVFYRTALGRAFRATSDNQDIAQLMGLNRAHIFGLAMALSLAVTAVAGIFLGIRTSFDPSVRRG